MYKFPVSYINSNNGSSLLGFGEGKRLVLNDGEVLDKLQSFIDWHKGEFIFLCLSYDLKNDIENLESSNVDSIDFPKIIAWVPKYVVKFYGNKLFYAQGKRDEESAEFIDHFIEQRDAQNRKTLSYQLQSRTLKNDYLNHVKELKNEIQQGNIYEINYCQEFYAKNVELYNPLDTYFKLNEITLAPYSSYFNFDDFIVFSGSPEQYIKKKDRKLTSSPIKGTKRRGASIEEDVMLKEDLLNDQKERSENVMIVDLVRNDLSKIAKKGSVNVEELFGIYTFETVHQMISTVSCEVRENVTFSEILKATFPMGSMTGAPKISAMNLIEKHEDFQRGIYSGSIGFIDPNGDFDLSVIIRTLVYSKSKKYLSCSVGGAITHLSSAEGEYEECMVKVKGILDQMNA